MSNIPGASFDIALSNGYMFQNARTDDFILSTTLPEQRVLFAAASNSTATVIITSNAVGINTPSNPSFTLDVNGDINFNGTLYQNNALMVTSKWSSNNTLSNIYKTDGRVTIGSNIHPELFNVYNGNARFDSNAYVMSRLGVGTESPSNALHVVGTAHVTSNLRVEGNIDMGSRLNFNSLYIRRSSNAVSQTTFSTSITNVNLTGNDMVLSLAGASESNAFKFTVGSNQRVAGILMSDGRLGVNTTNPTLGRLHVEKGGIYLGDSTFYSNVIQPTPTNNKIVFDNSYNNTPGVGAPGNKIVLFNDMSSNQAWLGGFGVETSAVTYHSGGAHTFYTRSSHSNYGIARMYIDANGNIVATGDFAAFGTISDARLKENVHNLSNSLSLVESLRPVSFQWKEDIFHEEKRGTKDVGFIAQEVESILPMATSDFKMITGDITYKNLKHERMIPYLVGAIQELSSQVQELQQQVRSLVAKQM